MVTTQNPSPQGPQRAPGVHCSVVDVVVLPMVVAVVVVVVGAEQLGPLPGAGQASQQLSQDPTTPCLSVQCIASFFVLHFVPLAVVMQHVTKPGLPQVECAAHFVTAPLHVLGKKLGSAGSRPERVFATFAAHVTYCPWFTVGGLPWSHGQSVATCCRAANVVDPSGSSVAQFAKATGALTSRSDTPRIAAVMDLMGRPPFRCLSPSSAGALATVNHFMWGGEKAGRAEMLLRPHYPDWLPSGLTARGRRR